MTVLFFIFRRNQKNDRRSRRIKSVLRVVPLVQQQSFSHSIQLAVSRKRNHHAEAVSQEDSIVEVNSQWLIGQNAMNERFFFLLSAEAFFVLWHSSSKAYLLGRLVSGLKASDLHSIGRNHASRSSLVDSVIVPKQVQKPFDSFTHTK